MTLPPPSAPLYNDLPPTLEPLRPWQLSALQAWAASDYQGAVQAVTGSGKTMVALHAIDRVLSMGGQALVLVPTLDLVRQWDSNIKKRLGITPGLIGAGGSGDVAVDSVVVSTVQSAFRDPAPPNRQPALLVVDEVHRVGAEAFGQALHPGWNWRLGLTATWERSDGAHITVLAPYFGSVVYELGYNQALASKSVSQFEVVLAGISMSESTETRYALAEEQMDTAKNNLLKLGAIQRGHGSYMAQIAPLLKTSGLVAGHAGGYLKGYQNRSQILSSNTDKVACLVGLAPVLAECNRAIVFAQTVNAAKETASALTKVNLDAQAFWGGMAKTRRVKTLEGFAAGSPQILCAPKVLDEGLDVPAADLGIIMAASSSQRQMIQRMGRVIRPKEGRPARFVVFYCINTIEDPQLGAHKDFLDQVRLAKASLRQIRIEDPHTPTELISMIR